MKKRVLYSLIAWCMIYIISSQTTIISMATEATPTDATEFEWNEENREYAWMTYLLTDWPDKALVVPLEGNEVAINWVGDEYQGYNIIKMYGGDADNNIRDDIQETLEKIDQHSLDLNHEPIMYKNLLICVCVQYNLIFLNAMGYPLYNFNDAEDFQWSDEIVNRDGEHGLYKGCTNSNGEQQVTKHHYHDLNDIALCSIFIDKGYRYAYGSQNKNDPKVIKAARSASVKRLLKAVANVEKVNGAGKDVGDVRKCDEQLIGMLVSISCPYYKRSFNNRLFHEHLTQVVNDYKAAVRAGAIYPWIKALDMVDSSQGGVTYDPRTGTDFQGTGGDFFDTIPYVENNPSYLNKLYTDSVYNGIVVKLEQFIERPKPNAESSEE